MPIPFEVYEDDERPESRQFTIIMIGVLILVVLFAAFVLYPVIAR